jgi:hypothetical protein
MRYLTLSILTIVSGGLLAASDAATVTYIDGNVAELSPGAGATLHMDNPQSMELKPRFTRCGFPTRRFRRRN